MKCEICDEPAEELSGCDKCGRMFGPCCNSEQSDYCEGCAE